MPVPINYRKGSEGVFASYSAIELATGRGITNFYLADAYNSKRFLSSVICNSHIGYLGAGESGFNIDFDLLIRQPIRIEGTTIVSLPIYCQKVQTNPQSPGLLVSLRKVSGGTETTLVEEYISRASLVINTLYYYSSKLTMPLTHFKIGDTLRLKLSGAARTGVGEDYTVCFDPSGFTQTTTLTDTKAKILLPIVVDI